LAAAVAALWLPAGLSLAASALSVVAFNWLFVPPRGTFAVDLHQHAVLLASMLGVSWIVALLVAREREQSALAQRHAREAGQLRSFAEALRDTEEPLAQAGALRDALAAEVGAPVVRPADERRHDPALRAHAQALCDQKGQALQRLRAEQGARAAREQAQAQGGATRCWLRSRTTTARRWPPSPARLPRCANRASAWRRRSATGWPPPSSTRPRAWRA
jgi:K+-sensing histidine kinase KdpD